MTKLNYLKFLVRTRLEHEYRYDEIDKTDRSVVNAIIDDLLTKPITNEAFIDILEDEFDEQIFKVKDELSNYRYFLKLSETPQTIKVIELLYSKEHGFRFKLLSKKNGILTSDSIRKATQICSEAQFKLDREETKILLDFMQYIAYMNSFDIPMDEYTITASNFNVFYSNRPLKLFPLVDEDIKLLGEIKNGSKQLIDEKYDVKIIDELMEKLDENTSIEDIIARIKTNTLNNNIDMLILEFSDLLSEENVKENEWSKLFTKYKTIFAMLFGDFKTDVLHHEKQVSIQTNFDDKIETVDKVIQYDKTMSYIELKRHDSKIVELTTDTRQNIHVSKNVHNGVMQLMYYISPKNSSDTVKNYIKKKNYLIIGDEEHGINLIKNHDVQDNLNAIDLYNNYLDNDIQVLTYRMVLNMLIKIKEHFLV